MASHGHRGITGLEAVSDGGIGKLNYPPVSILAISLSTADGQKLSHKCGTKDRSPSCTRLHDKITGLQGLSNQGFIKIHILLAPCEIKKVAVIEKTSNEKNM